MLLDVVTYRFSGHSPSDASAYRTKEEIDLWRAQDAIIGYRRLPASRTAMPTDSDLDAMRAGHDRAAQGAC